MSGYRDQIGQLGSLLDSLDHAGWAAPVPKHGSVRDLIQHLSGNDHSLLTALWSDGSDAEPLGFGGICNPVEVAFTSEGEALGTVSVYDEVEGRPVVVHAQRDPAVPGQVPSLHTPLVGVEDHVVAVQEEPDRRHVRTAVLAGGREDRGPRS